MQLRKEELQKQGKVEADISEVTKESVISTFSVTKDHMLKAVRILETEGNTKILGGLSAWLPNHHGPTNYGKSVDQDNKYVFFFQMGSTKATTFKINVGDLVFSSFQYRCTSKLY